MAGIAEVLSLIRRFAPESATAPDFDDNVGLILGSERGETDEVILCLDCTENVIGEAEKAGTKLVISHHPAIFYPLKRITDSDPTGRMLLAAARAGITVYSAHTNLDFCAGGLNDHAAGLMGLRDIRPLEIVGDVPVGRVGDRREIGLAAFADELASAFGDRHVRFIGKGNERIKRAAVINGGGGNISYVKKAMERGADCYVTADVPHHVALYAAQCGFPLVIMQHYAMEAVYMTKLAETLGRAAAGRGMSVRFRVSVSEYNPAQQEVL